MTGNSKFTPSRVPNMSGNPKVPVRKSASGGVTGNKLFLFIFMPLMIVISGVTVFFIVKAVRGEAILPVSGSEDYVYVLPMSEREASQNGKSGKNPFAVTGISPVSLEGIMYNPDGTSYAILKSSSTTYIKTIGDEIGDTGWVLAEITETSVTVKKDEISEVLTVVADATGISIIPEE